MFLEPSTTELAEVQQEVPLSRRPKRRRRGLKFGIVAGMLSIAAVFCIVYVGVAATRIVEGGVEARGSLLQAKERISEGDFLGAQQELATAGEKIAYAQTGADLVNFLSHVPWVGVRYDAAVGMLSATKNTVEVIEDALGIVVDVYNVVVDARSSLEWKNPDIANVPIHDLPTSVKRELFVRLADSLPELRKMQVKLDLASEDITRFQALPETQSIADVIESFADVVTELKTSVDFMVPFAGITREFAGLRGERQFLILFLNDTELRPTGGFLGTYGLLLIKDGDMKWLHTDDVYNVDVLVAGNPAYAVQSPAPIAQYLEQPVWFFRDGTWSPDFPTGAREVTSLFRQELAVAGQPVPQIDGVIGITTGFLEHVLDFVGPVDVNGTTYTSTSAAEVLEYQVEIAFEDQGIARTDRKDVVGELTNAVLDALLEVPPSRITEVFTLLVSAFAEKDAALYSSEQETQKVLIGAGWAGDVAVQNANDVLMVVDANMASLKSDPAVKREISYGIAPANGGFQATASITYTHTGSFDWKTSRYRTYTRIFVPEGSQLVSVAGSLANDAVRNPQGLPGEVTTIDELGLTSFGTFTSIEPGQSRTLTFVYNLPASVATAIANGSYTLRTIKQMGAAPHTLNLNLNFGKNLQNAIPAESSAKWGDHVYSFTTFLSENKEFWVEL